MIEAVAKNLDYTQDVWSMGLLVTSTDLEQPFRRDRRSLCSAASPSSAASVSALLHRFQNTKSGQSQRRRTAMMKLRTNEFCPIHKVDVLLRP